MLAAVMPARSGLTYAQSNPAAGPNEPARRRSNSRAGEKAARIALVHNFIDRASTFKGVEARIRTLANLSDLLWRYDEPYARRLFSKILGELNAQAQAHLGSADESAKPPSLSGLRDEVIARIAKHDAPWARRLITSAAGDEAGTDAERLTSTLRTSYALAGTDPAKAGEFASLSLRYGISDQLRGFLFYLRNKDEQAADALFSATLQRLVAQPSVEANLLLSFGTYVFNSPNLSPSENAVEMVSVGGLPVVNVSGDRPNVPREVILAYLNAAVTILTRPAVEPAQQQLYYIAGYQLFPKVQQYLPARTPELAASMQRRVPNLPQNLLDSTTYESLAAATDELVSPDDAAAQIDNIQNETQHDVKTRAVVYDLFQAGKISAARVIAAKTKSSSVREQLLTLLDFADARKKIDGGELAEAEKRAAQLEEGVERALLFLGIANKRAELKDRYGTLEAAGLALKSARAAADPQRPLLMLLCARFLAGFDMYPAEQALREAFQVFNKQLADKTVQARWVRTVKMDTVARDFSLRVDGVEGGIEQSILGMSKKMPDETIAALQGLNNETALGLSMLAVASGLLN